MISYYTAAEIADAWGRPIGTIHRLASTERWPRVGDGRRPALYRAEAVDDTMGRLAKIASLTPRPAAKSNGVHGGCSCSSAGARLSVCPVVSHAPKALP